MMRNPCIANLYFLLILAASAEFVPGATAEPYTYKSGQKLGLLENKQIRESSGLACSRLEAGLFWTHNDSGDIPRLFAFDRDGKHRGTFHIEAAEALDWEDMASVVMDHRALLIIGDVGDNKTDRHVRTLYVVHEPRLDGLSQGKPIVGKLMQTIHFSFPDGPRDCESLAVDTSTKTIFLVSKVLALRCDVFQLPWPEQSTSRANPLVARRIARINVPVATAMDISPDGRRAIIATYDETFEFVRAGEESWQEAFGRPGRPVAMPIRLQGEAICYGQEGSTIYLTSERYPTPFFEVSRTSNRSGDSR